MRAVCPKKQYQSENLNRINTIKMQMKRKVVEKIVKILAEKYQPEKIILFGSYAYGKPTEESDIDLLIVKDTRLPFYKRLSEVRKLVSEARRGNAFEPLVVTPAELRKKLERGDEFFKEILKKGRVLYG